MSADSHPRSLLSKPWFLLHALRAPTAQLDGYREWSSRCASAAVGLGPTSGSGSFPMYGTSIYNSLLMAGTMTDSVKSDSGKKDPPYPGESPTGPEFDAWEKAFANLLKGTDYPAGIQGRIPPSLIGISEEIPMDDMQEQAQVAGETTAEERGRTTFNLKIRQSMREEKARAESYEAGIQKLNNALAGTHDSSRMPLESRVARSSGLVNMSARLSSVLMYFTLIFPSATHSCILR